MNKDKLSSIQYGDFFCKAVDEIVKKRVSEAEYDKTVLCTISSDKNAFKGEYEVNYNNKTNFLAYSKDLTYKRGQQVYVQVPNGNWSEQKFIVGKEKTTDNDFQDLNQPIFDFIPYSKNLALSSNGLDFYLTANSDVEEICIWTYNISSQNAFSKDFGDNLSGYEAISLKCNFKSLLDPYYQETPQGVVSHKIVSGDYGLKIKITSINQNAYDFTLSQKDMNGNPYNFDIFLPQLKIFNIQGLEDISKIQILFFQKKGTFKNENGEVVIFSKEPNLYVSDLSIQFGYLKKISDKQSNILKIFIEGNDFYSKTDPQPFKKVGVRWLKRNLNGDYEAFFPTKQDSSFNFTVSWYKYKIGAPPPDSYVGPYWQKISAISSNGQYSIYDEKWINYNKGSISLLKDNFQSLVFFNVLNVQEKIKAVISYEEQEDLIFSEDFILQNQDGAINSFAVESLSSFELFCEDQSYGNYFLYNENNELTDLGLSQKIRKISLLKKEDFNKEDLQEINSISWIVPKENSMLDFIFDRKIFDVIEKNDFYQLKLKDKLNIKQGLSLSYKIKKYYNNTFLNNNVVIKIQEKIREYSINKTFSFGQQNLTSSKQKMILRFRGKESLSLLNASKDFLMVQADLQELPKGGSFSWKLLEQSYLKITVSLESQDHVKIEFNEQGKLLKQMPINFSVIECIYKYQSEGQLRTITSKISIPISYSEEYLYINGVSSLIYDKAGFLRNYFKNNFKITYLQEDKSIISAPGQWELFYYNNLNSLLEKELPSFSLDSKGEYFLKTPNIFLKNFSDVILCASCSISGVVVWSQPIFIDQDRLYNEQNSEEKKIEISAQEQVSSSFFNSGKKDLNNQYTGIILGDLHNNKQKTNNDFSGFFCYKQGAQTLQVNDSGEVLIGNDSNGKISFNDYGLRIFSKENEIQFLLKDNNVVFIKNNNNITVGVDSISPYVKFNSLIIRPNSTSLEIYREESPNEKVFSIDNNGTTYVKTLQLGNSSPISNWKDAR